ncbi:MAG: M20/M25/M40 family metallo-hydrolase [Rubrobacteraceae bacterium]|nr:M20/M25/M40 family metallo-hydrolase [Rubrobacteraceae bacterium]MBA3615398.1 M20/M25/M40 family metallo-hydrolase [Rubrobacteraceae bacterium]MDQ3251109.1 M20/M25/M40 family metallo-hydrolase [Actinomycetota bacterium]MDQ3438220.1 M20/M25/M40 family metallo-hydrolase [Actinomycetota bacterium]
MSLSSTDEQAPFYERPDELLQRLIRFETTNPPGNERECVEWIDGVLRDGGYETKILAKDPERPNLLARLKGRDEAQSLLLYGHIDVVPVEGQNWQHPPFEGKNVNGWVWGRGALDMKGGVAMMLATFLRAKAEGLTPPGDVLFLVLSDEESGGDYGAKYLVEEHARLFDGVRYALGEFGGFPLYVGRRRFYPIQVAEKQLCFLRAVVRGPGGHGALPMRGGAMAKLARLLKRLDRRRLPVHVTPVARRSIETMAASSTFPTGTILRGLLDPRLTDRMLDVLRSKGRVFDPLLHNSVNATIVRGGEKINVIPSEVTVELDGRLLPGYTPADAIAELRRLVGEDIAFEVIRYDPGPSEPDMGLFDALAGILREADPDGIPVPLLFPAITDARFFSRLGIQTYGFLPMKLPAGFDFSQTIHAADERIPAEALNFGAAAIYKALQRFEPT